MRAMKLVRLRRRLVASAMGAGLMLAASAGYSAVHPAVHHNNADVAITTSVTQPQATYHTDELSWS